MSPSSTPPESPEQLKVTLQPMTLGIFAGDPAMFPDPGDKYRRISDAAIQAARNEADPLGEEPACSRYGLK